MNQPPRPIVLPVEESRVSIVDVAVVLAKRWRTVAVFVLMGLGFGVFLAVVDRPQFHYSSVIQIGRLGKELWIESGESLQSKIESVYFPMALNYVAKEQPDLVLNRHPSIHCSVSSGSVPAITISTRGGADEEQLHKSILNRIVEMISTDHDKILESARKQIASQCGAVLANPEPADARSKQDLLTTLSSLQPTSALGPMRTVDRIGPGPGVQMALAILCGLGSGLIGAFLVEVWARARAQLSVTTS